ncbi:Nonsense-mediated mRNA decay protein 5 [Coemansia sp. RSA 2322]|nr:Nonsense-mediated mRNA decay protein 5 [Coemansia sp. RSA 2322]
MVPGFISLAAAYLLVSDAIETTQFLVYALEVVLNALHYNAVIALTVLEQYKWTDGIFTRLLQNASKFSRVHDKKLMILGLTAILNVPANQLPPALQSGLPQLFEGILKTFRSLDSAVEARAALERMYEGDSDEEDLENEFEWDGNEEDGDDFELGDDDADVDDLENEYLKHLASKASKALGGDSNDDDDLGGLGLDDDDDDDDDDALEEEYSLDTPLDGIDAHIFLQEKLSEMQATNTAAYNAIIHNLSAENSQFLQSLIEEADRKQNSDNEHEVAAPAVVVPKKKWDDEENDSDSSIPDDWDASDSEESETEGTSAEAKGDAATDTKPAKKKSLAERIAERQAERESKKAAGGDGLDFDDIGPSRKQREVQMQLESDMKNADDLFAGLTVKDVKIKDALTGLNPKTEAEFDELQAALVERIQKCQSHRLYSQFLEKLMRDLALPLKDVDVRKFASVLTTLANEKQRNARDATKKKKSTSKKAAVVTSAPKDKVDMNDYSNDVDDYDDFM